MINLDNKVAVVIGGTNALGKAIALNMASQGARVIMTGSDEDDLQAAMQEINEKSLELETVTLDPDNQTMLEEAAQKICSNHSVHILVHNCTDAGMKNREQCFDAFGKYMKDRNEGAVCCVHHADDANSNAGADAVIRRYAADWAGNGVRVNSVEAGPLDDRNKLPVDRPQSTDANPRGKKTQPWEVAAAVTFLSSPAAAAITGQNLRVDGGLNAEQTQSAAAEAVG